MHSMKINFNMLLAKHEIQTKRLILKNSFNILIFCQNVNYYNLNILYLDFL